MTPGMAPDDHADRWLRAYDPAPASSVQLVAFPHAGGAATFFRPMSRALQPAVSVIAVQYPGRQERHREPAITNLMELADQVSDALMPRLTRPTAFFGHSFGATLAYEVARRVEERGNSSLTVLFASGRRAPSLRSTERLHYAADDAIISEMRLLSGTDPRVLGDAEMLRLVLPALRADYTAIENYVCPPGSTIHCPIIALVGDDDSQAGVDEVRAWAHHTTGQFDLRIFRGGHFYLVPRQDEVLSTIAEELRLRNGSPPGNGCASGLAGA